MANTVDIQPPTAAAAGCGATCEFNSSDSNLPYWEYVYYKLTATPADGWTFGYFEWSLHIENATTGDSWDDGPYQLSSNPGTSTLLYDGFIDLSELGTGQGREVTTITGLKAVFVRAPTHLLVNSFNRNGSSPVQLVYDDRAGHAAQLVADY